MGRRILAGAALALLAALAGGAYALTQVGVAPRELAPYLAKRTNGHNALIAGIGEWASMTLMRLDRGEEGISPIGLDSFAPVRMNLKLGAQAQPAGSDAVSGLLATTPDEVRAALAKARPGDVITLAPGTYRFDAHAVEASRPGAAGAAIVVRAAHPGTVHLEFDQTEGFLVSAPYWRFENLDIRGVCAQDVDCEHAFHVVGKGAHFAAVNNTIADFNAHFKINGLGGDFPDDGLIESNTLTNTRARDTRNPVTPIDLVAASRWTIRGNLIEDFVKTQGNGVSYGAFAKGAGSANVFERNLIRCEHRLRGAPGEHVGLSLGGGGTGPQFCRDGKCIVEQQGSTIRGNLIASCSDVGIYLNSAADSRIEDNTLLDTTGIDVRFPASSAHLDGNLVDGPIHSRNGGMVHLGENQDTPLWMAYVGHHPVRDLFAAPLQGDFAVRAASPARDEARKTGSLCGDGLLRHLGAFDDFSGCLRPSLQR
jgi:parallel beta-helix repeat protein